MNEHRVSMLGNSLRRNEDPTHSRDPQIVALLDALSRVDVAPPPRAHFRAELRAQLVAVAPRIVAEGVAEGADMVDVPRPTASRLRAARRTPSRPQPGRPADEHPGFWDKLRAVPILRPLGAAVAVLTVFTMLLGGAAWMSQDSVPGDSLYGLKRASERFQLYTDSNNTTKAQDHLEFAGRRIDEARTLLERRATSASGSGIVAAGGLSDETVDQIVSAMRSADADTQSAARLLGDEAVSSSSSAPLATMTTWAPLQLDRLQKLHAALPTSDSRLTKQATTSSNVVRQAATRASALEKKVDCACMGKARKDKLGPVPCTGCATSVPTRPATPNPTTAPSRSRGTPPSSTIKPRTSVVVPPQRSLVTTPVKPGAKTSPLRQPILPLPLPLPTGQPKAPITVNPSCINVLDLLKIGCQTP